MRSSAPPRGIVLPLFLMYFLTIVLFCLLALAQAVPVVKRIVISPQITTPNASTIWNVGNTVTVTWCVPLFALPSSPFRQGS